MNGARDTDPTNPMRSFVETMLQNLPPAERDKLFASHTDDAKQSILERLETTTVPAGSEFVVPEEPPILTMHNPRNPAEPHELLSHGGLGLVTGKSKTGKSSLLGAIITAYLFPDSPPEQTLHFRGATMPDNGVLLHLDTEQPVKNYRKMMRAIFRRAGKSPIRPERFQTYALRSFSPEEMRQALEARLEATRAAGLHTWVCIIDGIADFVYDVNDRAESVDAVSFLMRLADEYQTSFISVLHDNEKRTSGEDARGWLGSQMLRKINCAVKLRRIEGEDPDVRFAHFYNLRDAGSVDDLRLRWDNAQKMYGFEDFQDPLTGTATKEERRGRKKSVPDVSRLSHEDLLNEVKDNVFRQDDEVIRTDVISRICKVYDVGQRAAIDCISDLINYDILIKSKDGNRIKFSLNYAPQDDDIPF